jgi:hypothetical protein
MGAVGARLVRVYTILRPSFYDALAAYNRAHRKAGFPAVARAFRAAAR